jgi:hypothetical protein
MLLDISSRSTSDPNLLKCSVTEVLSSLVVPPRCSDLFSKRRMFRCGHSFLPCLTVSFPPVVFLFLFETELRLAEPRLAEPLKRLKNDEQGQKTNLSDE